jgi:hypothetical protein
MKGGPSTDAEKVLGTKRKSGEAFHRPSPTPPWPNFFCHNGPGKCPRRKNLGPRPVLGGVPLPCPSAPLRRIMIRPIEVSKFFRPHPSPPRFEARRVARDEDLFPGPSAASFLGTQNFPIGPMSSLGRSIIPSRARPVPFRHGPRPFPRRVVDRDWTQVLARTSSRNSFQLSVGTPRPRSG